MGMLNGDHFAMVGDRIVSVHFRQGLDTNLLSMSGGETLYELRVDGVVADTHKHGTFPRSGTLFATPEVNGAKTSIQVGVKPGFFGVKYNLLVGNNDVPLKACSEAEIKSLWHKKSIG